MTSLAFSPESASLASGSWDKSVRLWDVYEGRGQTDVLPHQHDVLTVAFRPDGKQIAAATLDGQVFLWDPNDAKLEGTIEGRRDMAGGKVIGDLRSGANVAAGKSFKALAYSADGALLLAGGDSKSVCVYDVAGKALLKKFHLSKSKAFDGTIERLESSRVTDAGPLDLLPGASDSDDDEGLRRGAERDAARALTSASRESRVRRCPSRRGRRRRRLRRGRQARTPRSVRAVRCKHVAFAPTGQGWCASTTEGVMVFSKDVGAAFDPTDLGENVTPSAARMALREGDARRALLMALRLRGAEDDDALLAETLGGRRPSTPSPPRFATSRRRSSRLCWRRSREGSQADRTRSSCSRGRASCVSRMGARCTRPRTGAHGGRRLGRRRGRARAARARRGGGVLPALRRVSKAFAGLHDDLAATAETSVFLLDYVCAAPPVAEVTRGDASAKV